MTTIKKSLTLSITLFSLLVSGITLACSCGTPKLEILVKETPNIYTATVQSITPKKRTGNFDEIYTYKLTIHTIFRGGNEKGHITTSDGAIGCGLSGITVGDEILVYTNDGYAGGCSGTKKLDEANKDLALLQKTHKSITKIEESTNRRTKLRNRITSL